MARPAGPDPGRSPVPARFPMLVSFALVAVVAAAVIGATRAPDDAGAGVRVAQVGAEVVPGGAAGTPASVPPVAVVVARVVRVPSIDGGGGGRPPVVVRLDATGSSDADGDRLTFGWDLDGDGRHDDGTRADPRLRLTGRGPAVVSVVVEDGTGLDDLARLRLPLNARG